MGPKDLFKRDFDRYMGLGWPHEFFECGDDPKKETVFRPRLSKTIGKRNFGALGTPAPPPGVLVTSTCPTQALRSRETRFQGVEDGFLTILGQKRLLEALSKKGPVLLTTY